MTNTFMKDLACELVSMDALRPGALVLSVAPGESHLTSIDSFFSTEDTEAIRRCIRYAISEATNRGRLLVVSGDTGYPGALDAAHDVDRMERAILAQVKG